jgi:hypothetical protein
MAYSPITSGTQSYSAGVTGFTMVAAPTDILNIFGTGAKTISITRIEVSGITSAATAITLDAQIVKRSTAGTLGSAALTALTAVPLSSNNAAATAVVSTVGTANYGTLGTLVGVVATKKVPLTLSPATATDFPQNDTGVSFIFNDPSLQNLQIVNATEQVAINMNAPTLPAGTALNIFVYWTEQ